MRSISLKSEYISIFFISLNFMPIVLYGIEME